MGRIRELERQTSVGGLRKTSPEEGQGILECNRQSPLIYAVAIRDERQFEVSEQKVRNLGMLGLNSNDY